MGNGKRGWAPCGCEGEAVIGQYYQCLDHDRDGAPEPEADGVPEHVAPEVTKKLCPHCGSDDLQVYPGLTIYGMDLYHCNQCHNSHQRSP